MKAAQRLKEKINGHTLAVGAVATNHLSLELVEILLATDTDYLIIDMEHGAFTETLVADICAVGRLTDFPVLIRPLCNEIDAICKSLDLGACGLLLPTVESTEVLDVVRDGIYLPPRGRRRPGGRGNRWVSDYKHTTWKSEVEDDVIILPQIESRKGIVCAENIAGHEISTSLAVGPYDLSADLGICGQTDDPELEKATERIRRAAASVGKNTLVFGDPMTMAKKGYTFICLGDPMRLLERSLQQELNLVRDGVVMAGKTER